MQQRERGCRQFVRLWAMPACVGHWRGKQSLGDRPPELLAYLAEKLKESPFQLRSTQREGRDGARQ